MKLLKVLSSLFLIFTLSSAFTTGKDGKGVYIAGVSASFTDSLIYFTDVLFVDSVNLDKNDFLPARHEYSNQLQNYMLQKYGLQDRTNFVYFNRNKEKLEKEIKKLKEKYTKGGKSQLKQVDSDFKFIRIVEY